MRSHQSNLSDTSGSEGVLDSIVGSVGEGGVARGWSSNKHGGFEGIGRVGKVAGPTLDLVETINSICAWDKLCEHTNQSNEEEDNAGLHRHCVVQTSVEEEWVCFASWGKLKAGFKQIVTWSIAKMYRIRQEIGVMRSTSRNYFLIKVSDREVRERLKENVIYCQKCCNLWDNIPTLMLQIPPLPTLTTHTQPM